MKEGVIGFGIVLLIVLAIFGPIAFMAHYGKGDTQWVVEKRPETPEEREAVAREEKSILAHAPHSLSGHDQDWDDAIRAVHYMEVSTACKSRLYEKINRGGNNWVYTGRVKDLNKED